MKRLYTIIMALATLVVSANAQSLSVQNIEAQMDEETALVVSLAEGSSMTALQFNLSLPEGVTLATSGDTYGATLGTATDGHTLEVETLSNGDLLFILYNTEQKAFKSGELLRIPITVGSTAIEANGKLYTVRTATADAVSHTCTDASFSVKVTEPEPAYKVGDDITSLATAEWEGKTDDYGGFANPAVERYTHAAPNDVGDILTQTVSGLENGTYRVQLEAAASFTPWRGFDCPTGDGLSVAFANGTQRNLTVVERDWVGEGEQKLITLTATVTDGTLKYGIKNLALSGNWFVARLKSIVYVSTEVQSPKTYAISIATEKNGKTTTDVTADEEGSRVFITATPDEDCTLESLKVTTTEGKEVAVTGNSFIMPASAVTVTATYKAPEPDAVPVITADNKTRVYSDENPVLTYSADMELSGKPELSTTATKSSAVGEYDITVGKGTLTGDFTAKNGKLTITKAPLTITASNFTITQGEELPTFTVSFYTGFKNGETEKALIKQPTFTCSATSASAPGTYDITMSGAEAQNYDVKYIKGTLTILKKEEPEPEPAYKVGDDITSLATADWEGKTGDYGGLANASVERYTHGTPADMDDILTQTVSGLENGTYHVQLEAAASFTPERGFDCPTGDGLSVVFANNTQRNLPVLERGWVGEGEQKLVTLTATVTDGTLKYGIKNLALSGNWFVARLKSIVYVSTEAQSPKTYAISIATEENGKTTTDVTADEEGSRVFITATPDEDCTLESLKITTTGGKEVEVTGNSFIMPASAVTVTATYKAPEPDAIEDVIADDGACQIFTLDGKPVETLQKGVNIIRYSDGTTKSVYVK